MRKGNTQLLSTEAWGVCSKQEAGTHYQVPASFHLH
jgi:hypothetical protein